MKIVHIASEITPVAKVGGLGDVVASLSKELTQQGHEVCLILPKYDLVDLTDVTNLQIRKKCIYTQFEGTAHPVHVWEGKLNKVPILFVDPGHPHAFFQRGTLYGAHDDHLRFACFCRAALDVLVADDTAPDIIHIHDWQTALIAPLFYEHYQNKTQWPTRLVFTIHNMAYQGQFHQELLGRIDLNIHSRSVQEGLLDPHFSHTINCIKAGIVYSDWVTTVSPNYAEELKTPEGGKGMDGILSQHAHKFSGVLNGIDQDYWSPEKDPRVSVPFNAESIEKKAQNRTILQRATGLEESERPLVGCVTRLVHQKAPHLIEEAIHRTVEKGGQFVLIGSCSTGETKERYQALHRQYSLHPHVHLNLFHEETLAHQIFSGADMLIVPSLFEPCGLTQLIGLRYGTVPIVRETGGLKDTVWDVDHSPVPLEQRNGYSFFYPDQQGIHFALDRALDCWLHDKKKWNSLRLRGMQMDFSWRKSVKEYEKVYNTLCDSRSVKEADMTFA